MARLLTDAKYIAHHVDIPHLVGVGMLAAAALALAVEPVVWLVGTWTAPAYDSPGGWVFGAVAALFLWSVTSRPGPSTKTTRHGWWLLAATALVRLAGRVLAIDVLGALALGVDVYAVGVLAGLGRRKRAVSPLWLAGLFLFSLPVERIIQRLVGYGLQHVSAAGACGVLGVFFDDLTCAGVDITLAGQPVLVDLPCSGARGLMLLMTLFAGLAAAARPSRQQALVGVALAGMSALVANAVRIAALAVGLAFPSVVGVDVMAQPWHDLIGLAALAMGVSPLVAWARQCRRSDGVVSNRPANAVANAGSKTNPTRPQPTPDDNASWMSSRLHRSASLHLMICAGVLAVAVSVFVVPRTPVDVARPINSIDLPGMLAGHPASPRPLSEMERSYFTQFGGGAAKADYGPNGLLVVRTSAPLRHLHTPDECLAGAGYDVESVGVTGRALPGATYRAVDPAGHTWRVVVTYVADDGQLSTSISEVIWRWMQHPETTWTAIERLQQPGRHAQNEAFDAAVARAFELGRPAYPP